MINNKINEMINEVTFLKSLKDSDRKHPFKEDWMLDVYIEGLEKELKEMTRNNEKH